MEESKTFQFETIEWQKHPFSMHQTRPGRMAPILGYEKTLSNKIQYKTLYHSGLQAPMSVIAELNIRSKFFVKH